MRLFGWFRKPEPIPDGYCQCGHAQSFHTMGASICWKGSCDCCRFIAVRSSADRELEELRKMLTLK